jgi:hypothetical protein
MWINAMKKNPSVDNIFNTAFYEGCRISTADLAQFGEEASVLKSNQFLLKGYGRYHHILAGKVRYAGEERYCIGVPGTKDYGALSLAVQYYAEPYIVANVPPNCFIPRPAVGSAVIRLTRYQEKPVKVNDSAFMFKIIRASFNQRRKTLQNGLYNSSELRIPKEKTVAALEEMGLTPTIRGEKLSLEEFAKLSDILGR